MQKTKTKQYFSEQKFNIYPEQTAVIRTLVDKNIPALLVGEAGMGKSYTAKLAVSDLDFASMNLSKQHDLIDLLGQFVLTTDKHGNSVTEWRDGKVTQAAKEGKVLILEELTMAEPTVLAALHGLIEIPPALHTITGDVEVHEDFRIIGTANPSWTNYQGVSDLNYAFEDRWGSVFFGFPDKEAFFNYVAPYEKILKQNDISTNTFYQMTTKLFSMYPTKINYYMSLRGVKFFCELLENYDVNKAMGIALLNRMSPAEQKEIGDVIDSHIPIDLDKL